MNASQVILLLIDTELSHDGMASVRDGRSCQRVIGSALALYRLGAQLSLGTGSGA